VSGDALAFENYRLPRLETQFSLDGREACFEIPSLALGETNQISLKASMLMQDEMPVKAEWRVQIAQPMKLLETIAMPGTLPAPPRPVSGRLSLDGQAAFAVKDISAGALEKLAASIALELTEAKFGNSPLPVVSLKTEVKDGKAVLSPCIIRIDDQNHLDLTADMAVKPPHAFQAKGGITMPALAKLNTLLVSLGAPGIRTGSVFSSLDARGELQPWKCEGNASLTASRVHPASLPHPRRSLHRHTRGVEKPRGQTGPVEAGSHRRGG
jgi:hypothetical protein